MVRFITLPELDLQLPDDFVRVLDHINVVVNHHALYFNVKFLDRGNLNAIPVQGRSIKLTWEPISAPEVQITVYNYITKRSWDDFNIVEVQLPGGMINNTVRDTLAMFVNLPDLESGKMYLAFAKKVVTQAMSSREVHKETLWYESLSPIPTDYEGITSLIKGGERWDLVAVYCRLPD